MAKRTSRSKPGDATANETAKAPKPLTSARSKGTAQAQSETTGAPAPPDVEPTDDDIRHRAYQRYLERGGADGGEVDDWLQAEQELRKRR
jgi:hypothetical protein